MANRATCMRVLWVVLVAISGSLPTTALAQQGHMLTTALAGRYGLTTDWATHIHLDRTRDRVTSITQHSGMLFAQTERGTLHAIDAETGQTAWYTRVGERDYPSLAATADGKNVAVVNGGHLYVLSLATGEPVWETEIRGAPAAPAAMGHDHIYVPLVDGTLVAYELSESRKSAWRYAGAGRPDATPLVTNKSVLWTTTRGMVFGSRATELDILFRFETGGPVLCTPAYRPPLVYVASMDRYVYAIDESTALVKWRFSAGAPLGQSPVVIEDDLFTITDAGGMYSLDAETGAENWWTQDVTQFLAASPTRVYAADAFGRMLILNSQTGTRLATLNTVFLPLKVTNIETDRLYLGTDTGILQCVRETALVEPAHHRLPLTDGAPSVEPEADAVPAADAAPSSDEAAPVEPTSGEDAAADPFDTPAPAEPGFE
jgi:outer membrane protein assembly factor BamB